MTIDFCSDFLFLILSRMKMFSSFLLRVLLPSGNLIFACTTYRWLWFITSKQNTKMRFKHKVWKTAKDRHRYLRNREVHLACESKARVVDSLELQSIIILKFNLFSFFFSFSFSLFTSNRRAATKQNQLKVMSIDFF